MAALSHTPLKAIMEENEQNKGLKLIKFISPTTGFPDRNPTKTYIRKLKTSDIIPPKGTRILAQTTVTTTTNRRDKNGNTPASQRYIDICSVKTDRQHYTTNEKGTINDTLHEQLKTHFDIDITIGAQAINETSTPDSFNALDIATYGEQTIPDIRGNCWVVTPTPVICLQAWASGSVGQAK